MMHFWGNKDNFICEPKMGIFNYPQYDILYWIHQTKKRHPIFIYAYNWKLIFIVAFTFGKLKIGNWQQLITKNHHTHFRNISIIKLLLIKKKKKRKVRFIYIKKTHVVVLKLFDNGWHSLLVFFRKRQVCKHALIHLYLWFQQFLGFSV